MNPLRALFLGGLLAVVAAACSGGGSAASVGPPPDAEATIEARNNAFEPAEIRLPAGEPSQLFFRNLDAAPHNVAVYADASAEEAVFVGEIVSDAATLYEVPASDPGEYVFRCDVHPDMTGTLVVER